jgi:hypothetical protein
VKFRSLPKKTLNAKIPDEVITRIGYLSVEEGRPDNEIITRLLCSGLGIDPSTYGIKPVRKVRKRSVASCEG